VAPAQMALPIDRRNGASAGRPILPDDPPASQSIDVGQCVLADITSTNVDGADPAVVTPVSDTEDVAVPVWVGRVTTMAVVAVAAVAAVASYEHMRALAELAGEGWRSWLLPISVDGLAVAASMTMLVRRRAGQPAGALPWVALLLGLGASLAANVAAAEPTVVGRLVAAWPPVGLLLSYELLLRQTNGAPGRPGVPTVRPGAVQPLDGGNQR
jgi:Protein of unknown function (DUF2637)